MDVKTAKALEERARTLLPAETAMWLECRADSGDRMSALLLRQVQHCGMFDEPLCEEPYRTVCFADRVLLRCEGCAKAASMPKIRGIGYGYTEEEAKKHALFALTLPVMDDEREYGEGDIRMVEESCPFNRVAYTREAMG